MNNELTNKLNSCIKKPGNNLTAHKNDDKINKQLNHLKKRNQISLKNTRIQDLSERKNKNKNLNDHLVKLKSHFKKKNCKLKKNDSHSSKNFSLLKKFLNGRSKKQSQKGFRIRNSEFFGNETEKQNEFRNKINFKRSNPDKYEDANFLNTKKIQSTKQIETSNHYSNKRKLTIKSHQDELKNSYSSENENSNYDLKYRINSEVVYGKSKFNINGSDNNLKPYFGSFEKRNEVSSSEEEKDWITNVEENEEIFRPKIKIIKLGKKTNTAKKPKKKKNIKNAIKLKLTESVHETTKKVMKKLNENLFFNAKIQHIYKYNQEIKLDFLKNSINSNSTEVFILGKKMNSGNHLDWVIKNFKIFTYRNGMNICFKDQKVEDDCGWGCMIRSGQMTLYNMLVKFFISQYKIDVQKVHLEKKKCEQQKIFRELFRYFNSVNESIFCFKNLIKIAFKKFDKKIGEYWDSQFFFKIISYINKHYKANIFNSEKKEVSTKNIPNKIYQLVNSFHVEICKIGMIPDFKIEKIMSNKKMKKSIMTSIFLQLGESKCEPKFKKYLFKLMEIESFCGMISGENQKGYYFFGFSKKISDTGYKNSHFIYLDPHVNQDVI